MKKLLKTLALVLVLTMCMTIVASAAAGDVKEGEKANIILKNDDTTVVFSDSTEEKMDVSIESADLTPGAQYLILVVKAELVREGDVVTGLASTPTISEDTILYIDQAAAGGTEKGTLSFKVYPSTIADSVIYIIGASGKVELAIVGTNYILGDADGSREIDVFDIIEIALLIMNEDDAAAAAAKYPAADADKSLEIDVFDIIEVANMIMEQD